MIIFLLTIINKSFTIVNKRSAYIDKHKEDSKMATKAEELKALEQIRKIVEGLGADSYIGIAFEGCFDDAEENIRNDFALSMNDRWQNAEQRAEKLNASLIIEKAETKRLRDQLEKAEEMARQNSKREIEYHNSAIENWNRFREQEDKADAMEQEIIKLKAKLYDMMMEREEAKA